ncbi:hypothetical protein Aksp01_01310 [Akkermansia sp. NBRC 115031]|uniref:hypothetical protein n=1 Tax=Akkermansia sp. NBRC 115031 TaxID=2994522 RepID=UPI00249FFB2A|nr:hypothetical protein [Akkermansia sp. NBRC 115031]GLV01948.1 hypothetical protein Aksp01_01310 [Akkermansia sp. NBRC 115031]
MGLRHGSYAHQGGRHGNLGAFRKFQQVRGGFRGDDAAAAKPAAAPAAEPGTTEETPAEDATGTEETPAADNATEGGDATATDDAASDDF